MIKKYRTLDLFAGIGGTRIGFELTGRFENALSAEIDKKACETYIHLFGHDPLNDVTKEDFKQQVLETNYDVLLAGFPCQAFSIAGQKEGFKDKTQGQGSSRKRAEQDAAEKILVLLGRKNEK